jgi:elongation factor P
MGGFRLMPSTSEFRNGLKIELDGEPFTMVEFQHVKPGKGGAFVRTKLKNLKTGRVLEKTFRSGESVDAPDVIQKEMQYLYRDGDMFVFMDTSDYDQTSVPKESLGEDAKWLKEESVCEILFHNGRAISIELPTFVELAINKTEPGVKGDTAAGGTKPAELETGATVNVPLFLNEGDVLKIDTRSGEYIERVKSS